jgi:peptidoglycan/xylan/chitin deacetylase (PgdA/CDA1 family)
MSASVSITVDVDGPWGLACRPVPGGWARRLTSRSETEFGLGQGLDRLLATLAGHGASATFFLVGRVALDAPGRVREVAAAGHEIAHHGHTHRPTHALDPPAEREEIERGIAALGDCLGAVPAGYRSPAWELTPATLDALLDHGFAYDSSLMGDDRPHRLRGDLVEVPVHWTLDDVPYLAFQPEQPRRLGALPAMEATWLAAHDDAVAEQRHVTYTMHPEHIGRSPHQRALGALLERAASAGTPLLRAGEAAARVRPRCAAAR